MDIGKTDALRDVMNAAYVPGAVTNMAVNNDNPVNQNFSKELSRTSDNSERTVKKKTERTENRKAEEGADRKPRERTDKGRTEAGRSAQRTNAENRETTDTGNRRGIAGKEPGGPGKNGAKPDAKTEAADAEKHVGHKGDTNGDNKTDAKTGKNQETPSDAKTALKVKLPKHMAEQSLRFTSVKELIKSGQVRAEQMGRVKDNIKENFTEAQKVKAGNNAEQVMLKNLGGAGEGATTKTTAAPAAETDTSPEFKLPDEVNVEKRDVGDLAPEKKIDKNTFRGEVIPRTENKSTDKAPTQGLADVRSTETRQVNELKIQKILGRNTTAEQYQAIRDGIANSVEDNIKMLVNDGGSKAVIQLKPPELGKIQVELVVRDNQVNARINTENIAVKEVILTQLEQLKSNIENAGIQVDSFDVEVGGFRNQFDGQFSGEESANGGGGDQRENGTAQDLKEADWLPDKIIKHNALSLLVGRSVNYLV